MTGDRAVAATFTQLRTFPLFIHTTNAPAGVVSGNGISCSTTTCVSTLVEGTAVTLSASANPEWTFVG